MRMVMIKKRNRFLKDFLGGKEKTTVFSGDKEKNDGAKIINKKTRR